MSFFLSLLKPTLDALGERERKAMEWEGTGQERTDAMEIDR